MTTAALSLAAPAGPAPFAAGTIYLRQSDFRDEDDAGLFDARREELAELAALLGVPAPRVVIENDLEARRGASAYKTPRRVHTASGLIELRTNRPRFRRVVLGIQQGPRPHLLLVGDHSRIARDHRDGQDLLDACQLAGASVVAPDDEGGPRWILTRGGTPAEVRAFADRIDDARRYSADIAAKVAKGRRTWAGRSYPGGRRPYGYEPDEANSREHRRLLRQVPAEAAEVLAAYEHILDRGWSLKAVARDLRERDVRTVTGTAWTAKTLRSVLIKPSLAALAMRRGELAEAEYITEPLGLDGQPRQGAGGIVTRPRWEAMTAKLTDPGRRTNTGRANEPRWLLSGWATCGVCGSGVKVNGGRDRRPTYTCAAGQHVRRDAFRLDAFIEAAVIAVLDRDARDLLRPPPAPDVDTVGLRRQLRALDARRGDARRLWRAGTFTEAEMADELALAAREQAAIERQLAASDEPDPLPEFREAASAGSAAQDVWAALPVPRRRAVAQVVLGGVQIDPLPRRGPHQPIDAAVRVTGSLWPVT
jgi:DNA invertase Pin-like site-specific DNA recombinase